MKNQPSNRRTRVRITVAIVGAAAAVAVAGGAVLLSNQAQEQVPVSTEIASMVPADSGTLVLAPFSDSWWSKVTAMAPRELMLDDLTPPQDLGIEEIGYSSSPDLIKREISGTGPLRVFYIESENDESAQRIADWLSGAPGYDHRLVHRNGRILSITATWVKEYPVPATSMAAVAEFKPEISDQRASMWFKPLQDVTALTGAADSDSSKALKTYLEKGLGFSSDAAWTGTSTDGASWSGTFSAGNVSAARIDFKEASAALMPQKVLAEVMGPVTSNTKTEYRIVDPGVGSVLNASVATAEGQEGKLGTSSAVPGVKAVADAKVTAMINVNEWNRAATGDLAIQESVLSRAFSANGSEMNLQLTYAPR